MRHLTDNRQEDDARRRGMTRGWEGKRREGLLTGTALSGLECLGGLEVGGGARALEARAGGLLELRVAAEAGHVEPVGKVTSATRSRGE